MKGTNLTGAVVAITGAARGIGLATATLLTERGAKVSIGDVHGELAKQAADRIGAHAATVDVRDLDSFAAFLDDTRSALGPIDVLINNAGVMPMGAFVDEDAATSDLTIDVCLRGVVNGTRLVLPEMVERGRGHVVNVISGAGRVAIPGAAVYTAAKFGAYGFTEAVRHELRGTGVKLTAILPSKVTTELASGTPTIHGLPTVGPEDVAAAIVRAIVRPRETVSVPRLIGAGMWLQDVAPRWAVNTVRRAFGDNRLLTVGLDETARKSYTDRVTDLAKTRRT